MSDEQFYEAYNSLLKAVAGVDGKENNMAEGFAKEMERRGITEEQVERDIAKYREKAKKKFNKIAEIAQLSDAELTQRIKRF